MVRNKTVLVIGAGASNEAGMPVGKDLKTTVGDLVNIRFEHRRERISGDIIVLEALRLLQTREPSLVNDINDLLRAGWRIHDAMPQAISIDNFIDGHRGDRRIELCGKLGIVRAILDAERRSKLYIHDRGRNPQPNWIDLSDTWFSSFFQVVTESCRKEDIPERMRSITLIVFNYDRCIEQHLYYALQNYYGISGDEAASLLRHLNIFHPYGVVGNLPWQQRQPVIDFGTDAGAQQLLSLADEILTFSEGTDPTSSAISEIKQHVAEADILVFLGFAFHRLNVALLKPDTSSSASIASDALCFATGIGISSNDCTLIANDIATLIPSKRVTSYLRNDLSCKGLFQEYWRSLALS